MREVAGLLLVSPGGWTLTWKALLVPQGMRWEPILRLLGEGPRREGNGPHATPSLCAMEMRSLCATQCCCDD